MVIRVPVIPGFNADKKTIKVIAAYTTFLHNVKELHLLPYHDLGSNKSGMMGRDYEMEGTKSPESDFMEELKAIVEEEGLTCKIGG
jgi:pyruvate formate lyase activating enzyme